MTEVHPQFPQNAHFDAALWAPALYEQTAAAPAATIPGPRERSLVRLVANLMVRAGRRVLPIIPVTQTEQGPVWVGTMTPWTLEQAIETPMPSGANIIIWGRATLTGAQLRARWFVAGVAEQRYLYEGSVERPLREIAEFVAECARVLDAAMPPRAGAEVAWLDALPTRVPEALAAFLDALDVFDSIVKGVRLSLPEKAFTPFFQVLEADPACDAAASLILDAAVRATLNGAIPPQLGRDAVLELLRRRPSHARAHAVCAELELRAQRPQEALEHALQYARAASGTEAAVGEELAGRAYHALANPTAAASSFRRALAADPRRPLSWTHLGFFAAQLHRFDEAEMCFAQSLELDPRNGDVRDALMRVRRELLNVRAQRGPLQAPPPAGPPG